MASLFNTQNFALGQPFCYNLLFQWTKKMQTQKRSMILGLTLFTIATLFYGYEYILRVTPSVMSKPLMAFFHINASTFGTLSACYFYAYTPMQLVVGIIVDRYNLRTVLVIAIFCCAIGAALMGMADTIWVAAIGRFLQGVGSAFAFVSALKIASIWLPANRFAWYAGINNTVGFLFAGVIGEVALNQLLKIISWQSVFMLLSLTGVILGVVLGLLMREEQQPTPKTAVKTNSFSESFQNLRGLIKIPSIWLAGLIAALLFLPTSVFASLWGIPYLEKLHHYTSDQAAFTNSMIFVGWAIGASLAGFISDYLGQRTLLIRIGALLACVLSCILLYVSQLNFILVSALFVLFGMVSSVEILTFVLAHDYSPHPHAVGTAIAFVNMLSMVGGMLFQGGLGELLDWHFIGRVHQGIRFYSLNDYQHAMLIIPISLFVAFLCSLLIKDRAHSP